MIRPCTSTLLVQPHALSYFSFVALAFVKDISNTLKLDHDNNSRIIIYLYINCDQTADDKWY